MKTTVTLLILLTLFSLNTFAQDSRQSSLPEGAKVRFGKGRINEIRYSPDGTRLAVASTIGIWLYDTGTYQEVALLTGHTSWVNSVAFSPDGTTLASGSADNTVRLWNVLTGAHRRPYRAYVLGQERRVQPGWNHACKWWSADDTIQLWDVLTGAHQKTLTGHTIRSIA